MERERTESAASKRLAGQMQRERDAALEDARNEKARVVRAGEERDAERASDATAHLAATSKAEEAHRSRQAEQARELAQAKDKVDALERDLTNVKQSLSERDKQLDKARATAEQKAAELEQSEQRGADQQALQQRAAADERSAIAAARESEEKAVTARHAAEKEASEAMATVQRLQESARDADRNVESLKQARVQYLCFPFARSLTPACFVQQLAAKEVEKQTLHKKLEEALSAPSAAPESATAAEDERVRLKSSVARLEVHLRLAFFVTVC